MKRLYVGMTATGDLDWYGRSVRYGTIDFDYAADLMGREPTADGPIFMVNFMKYREVADYRGGADQPISGQEADDKYAPTDVLAAIGADVAFFGPVVAQADDGEWDRMGIVRYPTRRAFMEMQQRSDFKEKHVHKEAGMQYTIVLGTLPATIHPVIARRRFVTFELSARPQVVAGTESTASLDVEGTIMGDGRKWSHLTMTWSDEAPAIAPFPRGGDQLRVVARADIDRMGKLLTSP